MGRLLGPARDFFNAIGGSRFRGMKKAYVTTLTHGDAYAPGVEALGRSLRATGTHEPMVLMVTADVPERTRHDLATQGWTLHEIEPVKNPAPAKEQLFPRFDKVFSSFDRAVAAFMG